MTRNEILATVAAGKSLRGADLRSADLRGADLRGANLRDAHLNGADLSDAYLPAFQIPQEGALTVWKKLHGGALCKMLVPEGAARTASLIGRKCRAEYVVVLEGDGVDEYSGSVQYLPGTTVRPDQYNPDIRVECTHGIHFFLTREEAEAYDG